MALRDYTILNILTILYLINRLINSWSRWKLLWLLFFFLPKSRNNLTFIIINILWRSLSVDCWTINDWLLLMRHYMLKLFICYKTWSWWNSWMSRVINILSKLSYLILCHLFLSIDLIFQFMTFIIILLLYSCSLLGL